MIAAIVSPGVEHASVGYFQRRLPAATILFSFLALTLPLCGWALLDPGWERSPLLWLYIAALGTTHFVLTFTVYCQSVNLRHFASTPRNRAVYFGVPLLIFVGLDLFHVLNVAVTLPALALLIRIAIRTFDFHHLTRQDFGVLQLFKRRSECPFPRWMRSAENLCFVALTGAMLLTFLAGGRFPADSPAAWVVPGIAAILTAVVLAGFGLAWGRSGRLGAIAPPLTYFLMQSASAWLATWQTSLYIFCLAMHYVEYHVLMVPRCFAVPLDPESRVDRVFGRLRGNKVAFYGVLLIVSAAVTRLTWMSMGSMIGSLATSSSSGYLTMISLFDGMFVFHYFIESFVWRFSDPHYRALGALYFAPKKRSENALNPLVS